MWEAGAQSASQNCAKTAHFFSPASHFLRIPNAFGASARSEIKLPCMPIATIFFNSCSSYSGAGKPAKESFMIVRFLQCDRNFTPTLHKRTGEVESRYWQALTLHWEWRVASAVADKIVTLM
jgi:hypothetical protein